MTADTLIKGGRIADDSGDGLREVDITIKDGVFEAVGEPDSLTAKKVIEAHGRIVLPGAIDIHVHFRQPGFEYKEDFLHGTAAAISGGITTVCDMPNTSPPVTNVTRFKEKKQLISGRSHADFGLWAGGSDLRQIQLMREEGAIGLKVYMNRSHSPDDPYAADLYMPDTETFAEVLLVCKELKMPVTVHVADPDEERSQRERLQSISVSDARLLARSYRSKGVLKGLRELLDLSKKTSCPVHIAHASLAPIGAIDMITNARIDGVMVTSECGPPALLESDLLRLGVYGVPFAFSPEEADYYWRAIADGRIDIIATDHAPHSREDKERGKANVWKAPPGYPGVETSLPLMMDAAIRGQLSWSRLVEATSTGPARILGFSTKGGIRNGVDADFSLVDSAKDWTVDEGRLHSKAGWSPFHGRTLRGRIESTYLRGRLVTLDGEVMNPTPMGMVLSPTS